MNPQLPLKLYSNRPDIFPVILQVVTGSFCHGTNIEGSDQDIRGVCIPNLTYFLGMKDFEQYEDKVNDIVYYGIKKYFKLACKGNLSALNILFVEPSEILYCNLLGDRLKNFRHEFISMKVIDCIGGFVKSQLHRMAKGSGRCGNREKLIEKYGFDTKFSYHAVMLTNIGVELLKSGTYSPKRPESECQHLKDIRSGKVPIESVLSEVNSNIYIMDKLANSTMRFIKDKPDEEYIDKFLVELLSDYFNERLNENL